MAMPLEEFLLTPDVRPRLADDCYALVKQQVGEMSGASGAAVKLAYKTVDTFKPGHIRAIVDSLLPKMAAQLEPYWADFSSSGGHQFGDFLAKRGDEVAQVLLAVTDARAAASGRPTIIKAYRAVRDGAAKHVEAALPSLGELILRYAPPA